MKIVQVDNYTRTDRGMCVQIPVCPRGKPFGGSTELVLAFKYDEQTQLPASATARSAHEAQKPSMNVSCCQKVQVPSD